MSKKEMTLDENKVQNILEAYTQAGGEGEPSIRALAVALNTSPNKFYAIARQGVPGAVYDPNATNWEALTEYVSKKYGTNIAAEGEAPIVFNNTYEYAVAVVAAMKYLEENANVRGIGIAGANLIDVDGGKMPKRKSVTMEMGNEQQSYLCFKGDAAVYAMVYQTLGYTVVREIDKNGEFAKEELRVLSNSTLNTKIVPPNTLPDAIEKRFSGAYAEQNNTTNARGETENANQENAAEQ